jgi:hypothetical protein
MGRAGRSPIRRPSLNGGREGTSPPGSTYSIRSRSPPDCEILELPNVFLSPHIGWYGPAVRQQYFTPMVDELERFFGGHEIWFDLTPRYRDNRRGP